jgi:Holliday junction resolvasome RuvABC endonuclease subunit
MAGHSKWANIRFKSAPFAAVSGATSGAAVVRILGIDPGSQATGFGVVDVQGSAAIAVRWGTIRTAGEHHARLRAIFMGVADLVTEFRPNEIAIERVFMHRNADSALKLGQARAAALCATFAGDTPEDIEADAADALAAAVCHAHERSTRLLVERVAGAR